jgi:hypothetical protein
VIAAGIGAEGHAAKFWVDEKFTHLVPTLAALNAIRTTLCLIARSENPPRTLRAEKRNLKGSAEGSQSSKIASDLRGEY